MPTVLQLRPPLEPMEALAVDEIRAGRQWQYSDDFDFTSYDDTYRERVERLIDAKKQGHDVVPPEEEAEPEVIDLMDALKQSVERGRPGHNARKPRKRKRSA